jgi:phage tail-like protein
MTSAARFRNPPPGPPNDPTWMLLDGRDGWPIAAASTNVAVSPLDCALVLQGLPGGPAALADPSGRFGGLVPPPNVALAEDGTVWLLDRSRGRLRRFDDCACAFVDVPCTAGIGPGARQLIAPVALAVRGRDLLLLDAGAPSGPPGRVLVFASHGFALRSIWLPPRGAVAQPWQPSALAVAPDGRTLVTDVASGAVHVFDRGGTWRAAWLGFGAVTAMAIDRFGRLYTFVAGESSVRISDAQRDAHGAQVALATDVDAVRDCFARLPDFASDASGRINLAGRCTGAGWFDAAGNPSTAAPTPPPAFPASGVWLSTSLDSGIGRCQWHRIVLKGRRPRGTSVTIQTFTAEIDQPIDLVAALPVSAWTAVPFAAGSADEALILSQPGRFLWLRAKLSGTQQATPRLDELRIEYPRISLRRYLPAAFGPDPVSADFTDRLLGIFDRGFRSVESEIDRQADLFDPRSAPAASPVAGKPDMLSWLAGWIGVTFDRTWPIARRRHYLMEVAKLYPCRGTLPGLRRVLLLFLGLDALTVPRRPAACGPNCAPPPPAWRPPPLILEHWKIRRWLFLGAGRLGDAAVLWGETIMGRSQLDNSARLGATRLDTTRDAVGDPFNADSYAFTVFVPGGLARTASAQGAVQRLLDGEKPAWSKATLRFVLPRMRIGIQASIGFDSVIGCWPEGVLLDAARLGRATVLSAGPDVDPGPRLGQSRVGVRIA